MVNKYETHEDIDLWLALLMEGPLATDPDAAAISDGANIIVAGTRSGVGVSTKCKSLRQLAEKRGENVTILDAGVISEALLENLTKHDAFSGGILITHKGVTPEEAARWLGGLGVSTRARYVAARYPWQADDDLMLGRDHILKILDLTVYRHVLGQLPNDAPEIKALRKFTEELRKSKPE
jgi:hypothetical protein